MADLQKIVDDLSKLTVLEAAQKLILYVNEDRFEFNLDDEKNT